MCGITAVYNIDNSTDISPDVIKEMTDAIAHRGPDDFGYWFCNTLTGENKETKNIDEVENNKYNLAFGHRRLSILDLSPLGHQPMSSPDGNIWLIYNGEIYNYIEIREDLKKLGYTFKSGSDTEVIIAAYQAWGEECLKKFNGMFSFAIWDKITKKLFVARDRFGIKPFNYYYDGKKFIFSSEIKSILKYPDIPRTLNKAVVFNYIIMYPDLIDFETFFNEIKELPPSHYAVIKDGTMTIKKYWSLDPYKQTELSSYEEYKEAFYEIFENAVKIRLRSDVPVGTCLSGGLDSSSIVCLSSRYIPQIHTFSACFDEKEVDERPYINSVLEATNSKANFVFPNVIKLMEDVNKLMWYQDEPFGSCSIFAQWCVMERVSQTEVKVVLDGQGSDEILAGYTMHFPSIVIDYLKRGNFSRAAQEYNAIKRNHHLSDARVFWYGALNLPEGLKRFYNPKVNWVNPGFAKEAAGLLPKSNHKLNFDSFLNNQLYKSLTGSLRELLRYEDRNSMAFSIESRIPFLDYRLVEFMYSVPLEQKFNNGTSKYVLRQAMKGILPDTIANRQDKMGFLTPEFKWFQTPEMKQFVMEILNSEEFKNNQFYNVNNLKDLFNNLHTLPLKESIRAGKLFWRVVNLQLWMKLYNIN